MWSSCWVKQHCCASAVISYLVSCVLSTGGGLASANQWPKQLNALRHIDAMSRSVVGEKLCLVNVRVVLSILRAVPATALFRRVIAASGQRVVADVDEWVVLSDICTNTLVCQSMCMPCSRLPGALGVESWWVLVKVEWQWAPGLRTTPLARLWGHPYDVYIL